QQQGTEDGECKPYRVVPDFDRFTTSEGPYARQTELSGFRTITFFKCGLFVRCRLLGVSFVHYLARRFLLPLRFILEVTDESRFEAGRFAFLDELGRRAQRK